MLKFKEKRIYLDYASGAPMDFGVNEKMTKCLKGNYINPSSLHQEGLGAKELVEGSRKKVAEILKARPEEIIFTSNGTESDNLAILGVTFKYWENNKNKPHIITTNIEHSAVLKICRFLEDRKLASVTYLKVKNNGILDPLEIRKNLKKNTILVSVMYANNEIGTIEPIREVAKEIRYFKKINEIISPYPYFHTDACQAMNYLPIEVEKLGVDLLTFNATKIYGPQGIGVLYKKKNVLLSPVIYGGDQELGLRAGTSNVCAILGLAEALKKTEEKKEREIKRLSKLRDYFIKKLLSLNKVEKKIIINGDLINRLPNNINVTFLGMDSEVLVIELDEKGIAVSSKSACKSFEEKESYVLLAINAPLGGNIRFSLGRETTKQDLDYTIRSLKEILNKYKRFNF